MMATVTDETEFGHTYVPTTERVREAFADHLWDPDDDIPWSFWAESFDAWLFAARWDEYLKGFTDGAAYVSEEYVKQAYVKEEG